MTDKTFDYGRVVAWLQKGAQKPTKKLVIDLITEELDEYTTAETIKDEMDALSDLFVVTANGLLASNIDLDDFSLYVQAVLESNESKYCKSLEEALQTVSAYSTGTHWDKPNAFITTFADEYYFNDTPYWIVRRGSDNKIMKSINYKPAHEIYERIKTQQQ